MYNINDFVDKYIVTNPKNLKGNDRIEINEILHNFIQNFDGALVTMFDSPKSITSNIDANPDKSGENASKIAEDLTISLDQCLGNLSYDEILGGNNIESKKASEFSPITPNASYTNHFMVQLIRKKLYTNPPNPPLLAPPYPCPKQGKSKLLTKTQLIDRKSYTVSCPLPPQTNVEFTPQS